MPSVRLLTLLFSTALVVTPCLGDANGLCKNDVCRDTNTSIEDALDEAAMMQLRLRGSETAMTTDEATTQASAAPKECHAWGDPHFTTTFLGGHYSFQGVGLFLVAETKDQWFQLQGFIVPLSTPASVFAGFAAKFGSTTVTIVGKDITIDGSDVKAAYSSQGLIVDAGLDHVRYDGTDVKRFNSQYVTFSREPYYYLNLYVKMEADAMAEYGLCSESDTDPLPCEESFFSESEFNSLCAMTKSEDCCMPDQPTPKPPDETCAAEGISYDEAAEKCKAYQASEPFFKACIFDYCSTDGDDKVVENIKNETTTATTTPPPVQCTGTKYVCHAWGDPHYTATFFGGSFDFMGLGLFLLAKTNDNSLEVQAFQYPTGTGESIFAAFAVKMGATLITIIDKEVIIDGSVVTTYNSGGLVVTDTILGGISSKVRYESPDDCFVFNSQWQPYNLSPNYYLNVFVQIAEEKKTTLGVCGSPANRAPLSHTASLFSESQLQSLCNKAGMSDCNTFVPPAQWSAVKTAEGACQKAGIPYSVGVTKCQTLQANLTYFSACILDYCVTSDDSMVADAVGEMKLDETTCDMYACPYNAPVNKGSGFTCPKGVQSCKPSICCEKKAVCTKSLCTADLPEFKVATLCSGKADSCDANTCCQATCDWQCYLDRYPPLKKALKGNLAAAEKHYASHGRKEGRLCTCPPAMCDWQCYLDNYPALKKAVKNNLLEAQLHYESHGAEENRDCTCKVD